VRSRTSGSLGTIPPRTTPPFCADHVGSLLRPPALLAAREDLNEGRIDAEELQRIEDAAIREVVRKQEEIGLQSATDGEFRRASWHMDFIYQLGGINHAADHITVQFRNAEGTIEFTPAALHVEERVALREPIFADDFRFVQESVTTATPKLTIPSPSMVHYRGGRAAVNEDVYPDMDEFWSDLTTAYADEVKALGDLGCTYVQFDDTSLAYLNDPKQRAHIAELGGDGEHQHETYISHINEALEGRPEDMTVTTHMCRGNFRSSWVAEGGYDFVAEALFNDLDVDGFFMEWDDARSGGFRAPALRAQGQVRRPGPRHHQARRTRDPRGPRAPHRRGQPLRRPRPALPLAPVRVLLDVRGQRLHRGAAVGQAAPDRRDGAVGLGLGRRARRQPSFRRSASRRDTGAVRKTRSQ
jgi:5-methyltetrahydropteroyltriglutamate--homocysteine methyltransferase